MKSICITCGTNETDPNTGYCKNDHDDWLEPEDDIGHFLRAKINLKKSIEEIDEAMQKEIDLSIKQ